MSVHNDKRAHLMQFVDLQLDIAEAAWDDCGDEMMAKAVQLNSMVFAEARETELPGHPIIHEDEFLVDEYLALVVDMRDSSKHLLCDISKKAAKATLLQRVFYEVSALLPMAADLVYAEGGSVTEYLGDGLLALFAIDEKSRTCHAAWHSARDIIGIGRNVVNEALSTRYGLPALDVGVGLAASKVMICGFGHPWHKEPKAIGECVYRATKLSGGKNFVVIDERLKAMWPKSKGGKIQFERSKIREEIGYVVREH